MQQALHRASIQLSGVGQRGIGVQRGEGLYLRLTRFYLCQAGAHQVGRADLAPCQQPGGLPGVQLVQRSGFVDGYCHVRGGR